MAETENQQTKGQAEKHQDKVEEDKNLKGKMDDNVEDDKNDTAKEQLEDVKTGTEGPKDEKPPSCSIEEAVKEASIEEPVKNLHPKPKVEKKND